MPPKREQKLLDPLVLGVKNVADWGPKRVGQGTTFFLPPVGTSLSDTFFLLQFWWLYFSILTTLTNTTLQIHVQQDFQPSSLISQDHFNHFPTGTFCRPFSFYEKEHILQKYLITSTNTFDKCEGVSKQQNHWSPFYRNPPTTPFLAKAQELHPTAAVKKSKNPTFRNHNIF